jgi:hypothetical protein
MVDWTHCFGACSEAIHHSGENTVEEVAHLWRPGSKNRKEGLGSQFSF